MSAWHQHAQGDVPALPPHGASQESVASEQPLSWDPSWGNPPHATVLPHDPDAPVPTHVVLAPQPLHVGVANSAAPTVTRDPGRSALAGVITFVVALVGLWSLLSYMNSMATVLSSLNAGNAEMLDHLRSANDGLKQLERKTGYLPAMAEDSNVLAEHMGGMDASMTQMLDGVGTIGTSMDSMKGSLTSLDGELDQVNRANSSIGGRMKGISEGLASKQSKVRAMRRDVDASARALGSLEPALRATNGRLSHVNRVVCQMGRDGVQSNARIHLNLGVGLGSLDIRSTVVPPGGWAC